MSCWEVKGQTGRSEDEGEVRPSHQVMASSAHSSLGQPLVFFTRAKYNFASA